MAFGQLRAPISIVRSTSYAGSSNRILADPTGERRNRQFRQCFCGLRSCRPDPSGESGLKMGYGGSATDAGRALGRSGDDGVDGVDGVIDQDALGLDRVYIQAKRYADGNNIGAGAIRDFFGSLDRHKASKGLFVTT